MTFHDDYTGAIVEAREALKAFTSDKSDGLDVGVYETEYDGQTYTRCMYCKYQEYGQNWGHEHNCLINRSKATLAKLDALIAAVPEDLGADVQVIKPALDSDGVIFTASHTAAAILHEAMNRGGE